MEENTRVLDLKIKKIINITYTDIIGYPQPRALRGIDQSNDIKIIKQDPDFNKYNFIYGSNGCGKTSISRAIESLRPKTEMKVTGFFHWSDYNEYGENAGKAIDIFHSYDNVFVFNIDYTDNNISSNIDNKHLVLSKEIITNEEKIFKARNQIKNIEDIFNKRKERKDKIEKKVQSFIIEYHDQYKNGNDYNIKQFRNDCNGFENQEDIANISLEDIKVYSKNLEDQKNKQYKTYKYIVQSNLINQIEFILEDCRQLLQVQNLSNRESIERLSKDDTLSQWIKQFFDKNREIDISECPLCETQIIYNQNKNIKNKTFNDFFNNLKQHYDDRYNNFIDQCTKLFNDISNIDIYKLITVDKFSESYVLANVDDTAKINNMINNLYNDDGDNLYSNSKKLLTQIKELINKKQSKVLQEKNIYDSDYNSILNNWNCIKNKYIENDIKTVNSILELHNNMVTSIEDDKKLKRKKIVNYFVYRYLQIENRTINRIIKKYNDELEAKQERLDNLYDNQSSLSKRMKEDILPNINELLSKSALKHLSFDIDGENIVVNYIDKKNFDCKKLSEGEKNFITFCYFITSIEHYLENNKNVPILIVIDDLHSSLDRLHRESLSKILGEFLSKGKDRILQFFLLSHSMDFMTHFLYHESTIKSISNSSDSSYFKCKNDNKNLSIIVRKCKKETFCPDYHYIYDLYYPCKLYYDNYHNESYNEGCLNDLFNKINIREFVKNIYDHLYPSCPNNLGETSKAKDLGLIQAELLLNPSSHDSSSSELKEQIYYVLEEIFEKDIIKDHFQNIDNNLLV